MNDLYEGELLVQGQSGSNGIAIGEIFVHDNKVRPVSPRQIKRNSVDAHQTRFLEAKAMLVEELRQMADDLKDKNSSDIISTHQQIIEDPEVTRKVNVIIEEKLLSADFAVYQTFCEFIERLKESGSELFRQRIVDLEDIRDRMVSLVCDSRTEKKIKKGSIVITNEISPTDLISFYENGISGLVMDKGGVTSHAAIIAQSLGIPCVVSSKTAVNLAANCKTVIIDGGTGQVFFDPDKEKIKEYKARLKSVEKTKKTASDPAVFETQDGFPFQLLANIEFEAEISKVKESPAMGVGLLRTESLLFAKRIQKNMEHQEAFYNAILEGVNGTATIRLFDVGGDKGSVRASSESNPFLGWRGIRMLLDEKEILYNQLRAILKTAAKHPGRVKILVPMVSVVEEAKAIRKEIETVQSELLNEGINIDKNVPLGLMVEVPSVALSAYEFAREVDFFSIGTNDLTQYTLAVDRGNEQICNLFQHYNPAVLRLINMTVRAAEKANIEVSVCGELAGDEVGAACIFGMGIKELSMAPRSISKIKSLLSSYTKTEFEELAKKTLNAATASEVEELFKAWKAN